jgi:pyruvate dehydrogenase E2 component (dihydrolipoamide acetyltransferase)
MRPHVEQQHGARLTYNDLLVKALALALRTVPQVNRFWNNGEIAAHATIDVSLAVQTDDNLLAPVIRNVAALTIGEIAAERERLVEKCRRGAARPEDFAGGSVTLSNLGPFGVDRFQAILNPGQSAILAVGSIAKRPFVDGDAVIVRLTAPLTLSVDHRVVDGVAAAKFLQAIVSLLESPMRLVL